MAAMGSLTQRRAGSGPFALTVPARAKVGSRGMELSFLAKGLLTGFSIAAPVGPIGVLCIRRSLSDGWLKGFTAGMGAATADAAYGSVAGFGLTAISGFLISHQAWLALIGGAFLCYLGVRTFLSKPSRDAPAGDSRFLAVYGSTLFLTLANPATVLSFVAIFSAFGLGSVPDYAGACALVVGVFLGSALWWLFLSAGVGLLRSRVTPAWMQTVNRVSGAVLVVFGIYALSRS
jgi:threonine/homoserine/homoserine lactone efflux protein